MKLSARLAPLQSNVFADMDAAKARAAAAGQPIIDLSLGSSDLSPPPHVLAAIAAALPDPTTHGYPLFHSTRPFRVAAAQAYTRKYGIPVDPDTEVLQLIGSQEGTAHLPLAILDPGDIALLQDPGYPSHAGGVHLAGGQVYPMPLRAEQDFLPVLEDIPPAVLAQARLMVLSYPHNPTTATAPLTFLQEAVDFCLAHDLVLAHDFPYSDLVFADGVAPSIFQADREKRCAIEFFSFSKSYHMGGFRIAYAIGNAELIRALRQVKASVDFNQYPGILRGAIAALEGPQDSVTTMVDTFRERREVAVAALGKLGWAVPTPSATLYLWAKLPQRWQQRSVDFCTQLVEATGVVLAPGRGFGKAGEGYVRFALVQPPAQLEVAVERIGTWVRTS
ncbi:MAG: LL-diaminopimelate aminotransferase [Cyanobacteria bacterium P01_A01_bin.105]